MRSQDQLQGELAEHGIDVAQPTLSRDLRLLGVIKGPSGYGFGAEAGAREPDTEVAVSEACAEFAESVRYAEQLVVVKTGPGRAQPLAVVLDAASRSEVLGTVAGDDTIFVACASSSAAASLADNIASWAGLA